MSTGTVVPYGIVPYSMYTAYSMARSTVAPRPPCHAPATDRFDSIKRFEVLCESGGVIFLQYAMIRYRTVLYQYTIILRVGGSIRYVRLPVVRFRTRTRQRNSIASRCTVLVVLHLHCNSPNVLLSSFLSCAFHSICLCFQRQSEAS